MPCVLCRAALVLLLCVALTLRFYKFICFLIGHWSILNDNIKTHLFFEFRFGAFAFPGKTLILSITGKSPATLILAGGHS